MIDYVRIVSPPRYPHSQCFAEVAEAFASAFDTDIVINRPICGRGLIFGAHLLARFPQISVNKHDVIYQSEVVYPENDWFVPEYIRLLKRHEAWDYSPKNVEALKKLGIKATFVPIRYMPCMTKFENKPYAEQDIDVLFYGSMNERRDDIITNLINSGVEVYKAYNVYGKERDDLIARSKIVLNIHQHDAAIFEIFRCAHLFANRKCVISESGNDSELDWMYRGCAVATCKASELVDRCLAFLPMAEVNNFVSRGAGLTVFGARTLSDELRKLGELK